MPTPREELKAAIRARLDAVCEVHPKGHQKKYGNRYIFKGENGKTSVMMFEKDPATRPNLWIELNRVSALLHPDFDYTTSLADSLYKEVNAKGKLKYGRHEALRTTPELEMADLVCFNLISMPQLDRILDALDAA